MENFFELIINNILCLPSFLLTIIEFFIFIASLLLAFRYLGKTGVYIFATLAFIIANIQVLRETQYFFQAQPIVLGTVAFCMVFLSSDILVEHYSVELARKSIYISFAAYLLLILIMLVTLAYNPRTDGNYNELKTVFIGSPRLLLASFIAYFTGQAIDIYVFSFLKRKLGGLKWLWLRSNISVLLASFFDNIIFSVLAWKLLASAPVTWHSLFFTYMLGPYWLIIFISLWNTPIIYLSYLVKKKDSSVALL